MKTLQIILCAALCCAVAVRAQTQLFVHNPSGEINRGFALKANQTITWKTGSTGTFDAGSTLNVSGLLVAAPTTGSSFDFTNVTVTGIPSQSAINGYFSDPSTNPSFNASNWRSDLGLATIATTGSASDLGSGTVPAARLPTATTLALGGVKVDGTTILINGSGVISAANTGSVTAAAPLVSGDVSVGAGGSAIATSGTLQIAGSDVTVNGNLTVTGSQAMNELTVQNLVVEGDITGTLPAAQVSIQDTGGYFTGTDVEAALQELGAAVGSAGTVTISGTPSAGQAAEWASGTALQGVGVVGSGNYTKSPGGINITTGKVFAATNNVTLTGTDGTSHALPGSNSALFGNVTRSSGLQAASLVTLSSSSTDTYAGTAGVAATSYALGDRYSFQANTANTGAASLNVDGQGAVTIVKVAGGVTTALSDNDIRVNQMVIVQYDGTNFQIQSTLGNASGGGGGGDMLLGTAQTVTAAKTFNDTTLRTASGGRLADANGHELIKFPSSVTNPVNEILVSNAPTGTGPLIQASGDDSVIPLRLKGKGAAGRIFLYGSGDGEHTSTALDNVGTGLMSTLLWNMNGTNKSILGVGPANNVITGAAEGDMCYRVLAGLYHRFSTDGGNNSAFIVSPLSSYVNGVTITPATTTNRPKILAHGSDSVVSLQVQSKGTGSIITLVGGGDNDHTITAVDSIGAGLNTRFSLRRNGTTEAILGVGNADAVMTGAAEGDLVIQGVTQNVWISGGSDSPGLKVNTSNQVSAEQTTASTSTTTGALISKGGLGVAGAINVGGNVTTQTIGTTFAIKSGSNAKAGTVTLSSGAGTISSTAITANSILIIGLKTASGVITMQPYATAVTAGTSYTIAAGAGDNSTYNWALIEVN
jgi:hypothetical protein